MKKIFKKIVAIVAVAALAVGMLPVMPALEASAAGVKLYFNPTGAGGSANPAEWACHFWGEGEGTTITGNGKLDGAADEWVKGLTRLHDNSDGWGYVTLNGSLGGFMFVDINKKEIQANWNTAITSLGLTEAYFNVTDSLWYKDKALTQEILMPVLAESFALVGSSSYFGEWNPTNGVMFTKNGDKYTATINKLPKGDYIYKIVQDPVNYSYTYEWGSTDKTPAKLAKKGTEGMGNIELKTDKLYDVTFTFEVKSKKGGLKHDANEALTATLSVKTEEPGITAADIIAAIDAIGKVTMDSKAKIEYAEELYNTANKATKDAVTNYDKLVAARKAYDALVAAEEAAGYDVVVHFNNSKSWEKVNLYTFYDKSGTNVEATGSWPGSSINANTANAGWFSAGFNPKDKNLESIVAIFSNGKGGQTNNAELKLDKGKGEFWVTLTDETEVDGFNNTVIITKVSTKAPEGWVVSEIGETETEPPTEPETAAPGVEGLTLHFHNSDDWDKVGTFITFADWTQIVGEWPGAEMKLEEGSETWYGAIVKGGVTENFNFIFNNMVSDEEADEGAEKIQTVDILGKAAGEYWIVLGEADESGKFDVEVFTEAPDNYDGLGTDNIVADLTDGSPKNDDDETTAGQGEGPGPTGPTPTGDTAPIAAVSMLLLATLAVVVASKKRKDA